MRDLIREFKPILLLIIVFGIAALPVFFYLISGLADCPVIEPNNNVCSPPKQTLAGYFFLYTVFYATLLPFVIIVVIILLILTVVMLIIKNYKEGIDETNRFN